MKSFTNNDAPVWAGGPGPNVPSGYDEGFTGRWFSDRKEIGFTSFPGPMIWDAWLLFDQDAEWIDVPAPLVDLGFTVIGTRGSLEQGLLEVWAG